MMKISRAHRPTTTTHPQERPIESKVGNLQMKRYGVGD